MAPEMEKILEALKKKVVIGFVGGSDLAKQKEQLGNNCKFAIWISVSANLLF